MKLESLQEILGGTSRLPVHLVGICGVGMAGLAMILKERGFEVNGCDAAPNALADWLKSESIDVRQGHDASHLEPQVGWVVFSAAVPIDAPELCEAKQRGLPVFSRGDVLAALADCSGSVAVCGTHGKTTTATFLVQLLKSAGRDPSWCIGGETGGSAGMGPAGSGAGPHCVVEADESDGSLSRYATDMVILTNVEYDHMENFKTEADFRECFRSAVGRARETVVYCVDDEGARSQRSAVSGQRSEVEWIGYGMSREADIGIEGIEEGVSSTAFDLRSGNVVLGRIELAVPGRHNVLNACGAAAAALALGMGFEEVREGLAAACLPKRRFETVVDGDVTVISDYAHHPTEIKALIQAAKQGISGPLRAVFQPHRYTRTRALGTDFPAAFAGLDELILLPVYAASEPPLTGGRTSDLYAHFREADLDGVPVPKLATSLDQARQYFSKSMKKGDTLLVVGAGDVETIAKAERTGERANGRIGECLRGTTLRMDKPVAGKTTLKVGGCADAWVAFETREELVQVLEWTHEHGQPFHLVGGGSNLLISDLGLRGISGQLTGDEFKTITVEGTRVCAGAGRTLAGLLNEMERMGLGGLEFLDSIPGTVGGAIHMNAGAWGHETSERVSCIRCLSLDATEITLQREDLDWRYRSCVSLGDRVVLDITFEADASSVEAVREKREGYRARRGWMRGLRCAGSVFKNPGLDKAGRLLDEAGLKGERIGGAQVSDAHANVIVTRKGATTSDVGALMARMQSRVAEKFGIMLDREIVELG